MVVSHIQLAKRALVRLLLSLASVLELEVVVHRDSSNDDVRAACEVVERVVRGQKARELKEAKAPWVSALSQGRVGRPRVTAARPFRVKAVMVMLTYHGFTALSQWRRSLAFTTQRLQSWAAKHWCATLEACQSGKWHVHLVVQFHKMIDRASSCFAFEGTLPNVSTNDLCGEKVGGRNVKASVDRAFFYVYADKLGTVKKNGVPCTTGNYLPCWESGAFTYRVLGNGRKLYGRRGNWIMNLRALPLLVPRRGAVTQT